MELTTQDIPYAGGGPHSVEIEVAGETKTAVNATSSIGRNQVKIVPIELSDLGFSKPCIRITDIDRIFLVANSNDGMDLTHIELFASFYENHLDMVVDLDDRDEYQVVPVF